MVNREKDMSELNTHVMLVKSLAGPPLDESINRK